MKLDEARKAVLAFIAPGAVVIGAAVLEGSDGGSRITVAELVTAAVACIVTGAGVYRIPNAEAGVDEVAVQDVHPDDLDHDSDLDRP